MRKCFICIMLFFLVVFGNIACAKTSKDSKIYLNTQKKLVRLNKQKQNKVRKIDFYKHRLEIQEQKLEELSSKDASKKGEEK